MGIWSCLGKTLDEVRDALSAGKSGIVFSRERKDAGFRSALCAAVGQPDLKPFVSRNLRQFMPEEARYAYMATRAALEHAHLEQDYIDRHEVGVIYGNDSVAEATMRALDKFREFKDTAACGSGAIFQSMNSTVTMNLACLFHLRGINLTASAACASGSHAVGLAYLLVRNGMQDCVVCGGAQEANLYGVASFDGIQSFSVREDEPEKASRPFDRDRDGLVPGGGAATVVVEGCGNHGCEYMTGGLALVLGEVGQNFAAGMTGGVAYVFDQYGTLSARVNHESVELKAPTAGELAQIRALIQEHVDATQSPRGIKLLYSFETMSKHFVKVIPTEYERVLAIVAGAEAVGKTHAQAEELAFDIVTGRASAADVARFDAAGAVPAAASSVASTKKEA